MYERITKRVIVDAGHGGSDPGALGSGLKEKDLTLQAAQYMYQRLRELGIPAVLTRDSDISLPKNERINKVLSLYGKDPNVILVSNHINAGGGDNPSGKLTFFENLYNNLPKYGIMITEKAVFNL